MCVLDDMCVIFGLVIIGMDRVKVYNTIQTNNALKALIQYLCFCCEINGQQINTRTDDRQ